MQEIPTIKINNASDLLSDRTVAVAAQHVWVSAMTQVYQVQANRDVYNGRPGYLWSGSQAQIINDLFPELFSLVSKDQAKEFRTQVNTYLRNSGDMVCRKRPSGRIKAVWFISEHWSGLKVTLIAPEEPAVEPVKDAPVGAITDRTGDLSVRFGYADSPAVRTDSTDTPQDSTVFSEVIDSLDNAVRILREMRQVGDDLQALQAKIDEITSERDTALAELAEAVRERDELRGTIETLRSNLLGIRH